MARTVTISDDLAARLEERRRETGQGSLDDVAMSLMEEALDFDDELDPNCGYTLEEMRALIAEGEARGPAGEWAPGGFAARSLNLRGCPVPSVLRGRPGGGVRLSSRSQSPRSDGVG